MYKRKENLFDNICPTLAKHQCTNIPTHPRFLNANVELIFIFSDSFKKAGMEF